MPFIPHIRPAEQPDVPRPVTGNPAPPRADLRGVMGAAGQLGQSAQQPGIPTEPFMAPGKGLQILGEQINGVGDLFAKLEAKRLEAQSERQVAEAEVALDNKRAEFESWKLGHPDPTGWEPYWQALSQDAIDGVLQSSSLGSATRNRIQLSGVRWRGHGSVAVKTAATKREFELAGNAYLAKAETARLDGDEPTHEAALTLARDKGYINDVDVVRERERFKATKEAAVKEAKAAAFDTAQNSVITAVDVFGTDKALEVLKDSRFGGGQFDAADIEKLRNAAQNVGRDRSAEAASRLVDGIVTGRINSAAAVDAEESIFLTPVQRQNAKDDLRTFDARKAAEIRNSPQGITNGVKAWKDARDWNPDMTNLAKTEEELRQKFLWARSNVHDDWQGEVTQILHAKFGAKAPEVKVRPEIQQNISKSLDIVFDPEKGAIPWRTHGRDKLGREETQEDAAMKQKALDAQSTLEILLADWFKLHPEDAQSLPKAKAKMAELLPAGTRAAAVESLMKLSAPRAAVPGAQGDTGPQGTPVAVEDARITSYGYANDETPDSNSSAGIGAWVPDDEAAKIKAGQASGYKLRAGDIAVSPDIEEKFRAAGIIPGEQVTVTYKDGSTHTGRWMDRTANDAQAAKLGLKPLRGRFDIYSPRGRHAKDGQRVVSFSAPGDPPALYSQAAAN